MSVRHLFGREDVYLIEITDHRTEPRRWQWRNFLHFPAPVPLRCRHNGHFPKVAHAGEHSWIECGWCGVRPRLVQRPDEGSDAYWQRCKATPLDMELLGILLETGGAAWTRRDGVLGMECSVGTYRGLAAGWSIGGPGSEHDWKIDVHLGRWFWLFLHAEGFAWHHRVQRAMQASRERARDKHVAAGGNQYDVDLYGSREISVNWHDGTLRWLLWRNHSDSDRGVPAWRQGHVNPADKLLGGPKLYHYDERDKATVRVETAEGTAHDVEFTLKHWWRGRPHGPRKYGWSVEWDCREGIEVYVDQDWKGNEVLGSGFELTDADVASGNWKAIAREKLRAWTTVQRAKSGWLDRAEKAAAGS